jgi:hypothetical protein
MMFRTEFESIFYGVLRLLSSPFVCIQEFGCTFCAIEFMLTVRLEYTSLFFKLHLGGLGGFVLSIMFGMRQVAWLSIRRSLLFWMKIFV